MTTKPNLLRDAMLGVQQADTPRPLVLVPTTPAPLTPPRYWALTNQTSVRW